MSIGIILMYQSVYLLRLCSYIPLNKGLNWAKVTWNLNKTDLSNQCFMIFSAQVFNISINVWPSRALGKSTLGGLA